MGSVKAVKRLVGGQLSERGRTLGSARIPYSIGWIASINHALRAGRCGEQANTPVAGARSQDLKFSQS
jgi:hypothetical protein